MITATKGKVKATDITYIGLCIALITVCAWISIPLTVPITMQTFAIFTVIGLLGTKRGTLAIVLYIVLGAIGVPVFAGFSGGIGVVMGTTGGYIIGFVLSGLVAGIIMDFFGKKIPVMAIAMIVGDIVCYVFGTAWFLYFYSKTVEVISLKMALSWCVIPFVIPDLVKIGLSIIVTKRVSSSVKL